MRKSLATALCLVALPGMALAADLSGRWNVTSPRTPAYEGVVLIDVENRATWEAPDDSGRAAKFLGYVKPIDASRLEMIMTDRAVVVRVNCSIESSELLRCQATRENGSKSVIMTLTRVGSASRRLAPPR